MCVFNPTFVQAKSKESFCSVYTGEVDERLKYNQRKLPLLLVQNDLNLGFQYSPT